MSEISSLSLKIPQELKEQIKAAALENEVSISAEVAARLAKSFDIVAKDSVDAEQADVDNQHTEEVVEQPLSQKELKKIRQLIKDKSKGASKKK
ncbi:MULTISPECIES: Arc family DNA-binding protein [unclassified Symbiopectobacterium]|uniref:Arc family DNA-binding protein n=1 Tax=unclassified Symbiopectobacterium TaxID=2794573 RepID=UPI002226B1A8|nr:MULTISPECIES: Arc family DNA-binding protein [unclassified Symbiopectobacterium]MCW2474318.1 Arc family DNA-binding protein [Candidatus Symbiopectobacterium sp. NZEC151]MCW2485559.1 Arc family DNA-binding protein [Candidatus Symbiopectobacterium sp. NZEC127]